MYYEILSARGERDTEREREGVKEVKTVFALVDAIQGKEQNACIFE